MNSELREKGYVLVKGLVEPSLADVMYKMLLLKQWRGECFRDNHIPTAVSVSNEAIMDALLLQLQPAVEGIYGTALIPAYSYARVYFRGDAMVRHRDRGSCEVSVSIHLGKHGGDSCLWFAPDARVEMGSGDGAVYLGCEVEHWREPLNGNAMGQIFLHYVAAGGPLAQNAFDGNPNRFPPSITSPAKPVADSTHPATRSHGVSGGR